LHLVYYDSECKKFESLDPYQKEQDRLKQSLAHIKSETVWVYH